MRLLDETPPAERSARARHMPRLSAGIIALLACAATLCPAGEAPRPPSRATKAVRTSSAKPVRPGALEISASVPGARVFLDGRALGPAPQSIRSLPAGPHRVRVEASGYEPWEQGTHVFPGGTTRVTARLMREAGRLRVESDVTGAAVFLDRKYLGTTPLDVDDVALGSHQLNVSAEGHETHAETVEIVPGLKRIDVSFRAIRLDESLAVTHRHAFGGCAGSLSARGAVLAYRLAQGKHDFEVPLVSIERLEVSYAGKNLALKLRGGRTYNFTVDGPNADPLLVFQQRVERARTRLAQKAP